MNKREMSIDTIRKPLTRALEDWRKNRSQRNAKSVMFWSALAALTTPEVFGANVIDVIKVVDRFMSEAIKSGQEDAVGFWSKFGADATEAIFRNADMTKKAFGPFDLNGPAMYEWLREEMAKMPVSERAENFERLRMVVNDEQVQGRRTLEQSDLVRRIIEQVEKDLGTSEHTG